jgi:P27 family predicted phage terminase small subunit
MARGRKSKNPDLEKLHGYPGKRKSKKPDIKAVESLEPIKVKYPDWLSEDAIEYLQAIESDLAKSGRLTFLDVHAFFSLGVAYARMVGAQRILDAEGLVIEGYRGGRVKHPALMILTAAEKHFCKLAEEFGLTPNSRQRLRSIPVPVKDNAYERWKNRKKSTSDK